MKDTIDPLQSVRAALDCFRDGLDQLRDALAGKEDGSMAAAAQAIYGMKGRLILSGVGKSGHIARKLAATFASTGTPAYFVHPAEASHGDLGMIHRDDVLLLLSWSGETRELSDILNYAERFGVTTVAITGGAESTLARRSQHPIVLPRAEEACPHNLAPTTSTLLQLAIGDALAVTLLRMRGFSEQSFRDFHPGGKLGAVLRPVREIMHQGEALPLLPEGAPIIEVISEISRKGHGIVGLTDAAGRLAGVITDGDIRRYLESNSSGSLQEALWTATADSMMTRTPITVEADRLNARVLNVLETNRIGAAFVLEGDRPVGLVTLLQLLHQGVA